MRKYAFVSWDNYPRICLLSTKASVITFIFGLDYLKVLYNFIVNLTRGGLHVTNCTEFGKTGIEVMRISLYWGLSLLCILDKELKDW